MRVRLGLIAMVFLVLVLVAVGLSTLMLRSWDRTLDRRGEARMTADDVAELRLAYSDQETGVRGYQLSLDPSFLEPYDDGRALVRILVPRLERRDLDTPGYQEQLSAAQAAGERWLTTVARPTIADIADAPHEDVARARFEELRTELDLLDEIVNRELARLDEQAQRVRRNVFGVLFASALTAIAGTALAAMMFRRWVIQPLHRLGAAARALAHDDAHPLPTFDSPELTDVGDAVGSLQASLRAARDDALAAYDGLQQSAVLALQVRTELADEIGQMPAGWSAESMLVPAEGVVAGDCFDVGLLDTGHLYVVMIDVTGHGAGAALDALAAKSQLRAAIRRRIDPGAAIRWLSREMLKDDGANLLTASVLIIDLATGAVRYANAGHPPAIVTDGEQWRSLEATGPLVGAFDATWETAAEQIPVGWTLLVYTDGITDTVGEDRERFGDHRLHECLTTSRPTELLSSIRDATEMFRRGPRSDDTTALAIHRLDPAVTEDPPVDAEPDAVPGDGGPNANAGDGPATARAALSHGGTMRP